MTFAIFQSNIGILYLISLVYESINTITDTCGVQYKTHPWRFDSINMSTLLSLAGDWLTYYRNIWFISLFL